MHAFEFHHHIKTQFGFKNLIIIGIITLDIDVCNEWCNTILLLVFPLMLHFIKTFHWSKYQTFRKHSTLHYHNITHSLCHIKLMAIASKNSTLSGNICPHSTLFYHNYQLNALRSAFYIHLLFAVIGEWFWKSAVWSQSPGEGGLVQGTHSGDTCDTSLRILCFVQRFWGYQHFCKINIW